MKRVFQYFKLAGVSGLLCLFMAADANAQRGGGHASGGGGGGGGRSSGGGGGGFSRGGGGGGGFSGGNGGGSFSRGGGNLGSSRQPSGGSFGSGRNSNGFSPNAVAPQSAPRGSQHSAPLSFQRGGVGTPNRGSYGNAYRGGGFNNAYRGGYGSSIRGGFYRGGRYYPGGYGSRYYSVRPYGYRYYSPWHTSGGYYYNRGFYGSLYYPRLGLSLGVLPYGYYPFYWGSNRFFYSDGFFYQYDNNQYTVVEPPLGAAVNALPRNAQSIVINGQQYYEANGVYYTPVTKDDGTVVYQVAGKDGQLDQYSSAENGYDIQNDGYTGRSGNSDPAAVAMPHIGDLVYSLPADTRKIKLNGELFYVSPDDIYFQETRDTNGNKAYKVTSIPEDY